MSSANVDKALQIRPPIAMYSLECDADVNVFFIPGDPMGITGTPSSFEVDGVQRRVDTYTVRYVMGGMKEKLQISSDVAKGKVRRPDGSKFSKKELEAAQEFVFEAKRQLDNYLNPLFAEKAVASAVVMTNEETLLLLLKLSI